MKHRSIIISIIAVLALGLMGYGYAAWSATVTTTATVNTGTFKLGIATAGTTDGSGVHDLTWGSDGAGLPGTTSSAYDVGSLIDTEGSTAAFTTTGDIPYYTGVTETYANVYPDYQAGYTVDIANGGTIPISLNAPAPTWNSGAAASVIADYTVYSWTLTDTTPTTPVILATGTTNDMSAISGDTDGQCLFQ